MHKNRKVLNINKYYESEYMDGAPQTSDRVVKKQKYRKYDNNCLDFAFTLNDVAVKSDGSVYCV